MTVAFEVLERGDTKLNSTTELRELVHHLVDMDAPDLALDAFFVDTLTQEHLDQSGNTVSGLVERVRNRLRVTPSPNGSPRYLIRSDFNEAFRAYRVRPNDPVVGEHFYAQLKILIVKVLRDRNVYTQHWGDLHTDLLIRCMAAGKKFEELSGSPDRTKSSTPYSYFYKVLYRRVITLHQRLMRGLSREFSFASDYFWESLSSYEPNPEEMLRCAEEVKRRSDELRSSKLEITHTLFCNLLGWSQKPREERLEFLKRNLPSYFPLMKENRMSRAEVMSLMSIFPTDEVACANLGLKIEEFPLDPGSEEVRDIDEFCPKEFKVEVPEWAEKALTLLIERKRVLETTLSSEIGVGHDRLRAELTRLCKIKGVVLRRDKEGEDHVYSLGVET